jgi:transcriptional regulator with XRE-family HTH domain
MYERGEREPGLATIGIIADYFDVQTDYLLGKTLNKKSVKQGRLYAKNIYDIVESYRIQNNLTTDQVENILDWKGLYEDLSSNRVVFDEGYLTTIRSLLNLSSSPAVNDGISEKRRELIEFAMTVPEEKAEMILRVIKSIVEDD